MITARRLLLPALIVIATLIVILNYSGSRENSPPVSTTNSDDVYQNPDDPGTETVESIAETSVEASAGTSGQAAGGQAASGPVNAGNTEPADEQMDTARSTQRSPGVSAQPADTDSDSDTPAPVLSERVYYVIDEAQKRQQAGEWEESLAELNALYLDFDSMNPFEQSTLLNFYTNTLIRLQMWQESISVFTLMLTVEDLRPDVNARALLSLGQLHQRVDEIPVAAGYYEEWLEFTRDMPGLEEQTARVEQLLGTLRQ